MALVPTIVTGRTEGSIEAGQRVDFRPQRFDSAIVSHGYRLWWSRTAVCPCRNNEQTDQPDPTCSLCRGAGRFRFLPDAALTQGGSDAAGNPVVLNATGDAVQIHGLVTSLSKQPQVYERMGEWVFGTAMLTTQRENRIAFRDRFEAVDAIMPWSQIIRADGTATLRTGVGGRDERGLRFRPVTLTLIRSLATVFRQGADYTLSDDGSVAWLGVAPALGTVLTAHYEFHPIWEVVEHVHVVRDAYVAFGRGPDVRADKAQQHQRMPIQAMMRLVFLLDGDA
jgi:hypothetical protein